ncbi:MAG: cadmium-translocating P-type ATPase [Chloroflexi bacterium]|nr:cadmium-translocating P-type ATPase [Chloroflexota bacterium]
METKTLDVTCLLGENGECARCAERLTEQLRQQRGVAEAAVDDRLSTLTLTYDPNLVSLARVEALARETGMDLAHRYRHETLLVTGMDCADCATTIERALGHLPGVIWASVNAATGQLAVEYEGERTGRQAILSTIADLGYGVETAEAETTELALSGLHCADCAVTIARMVGAVPGVADAHVNFATARLTVRHDPHQAPLPALVQAVEDAGYAARPLRQTGTPGGQVRGWQRDRKAILTALSGISLLGGYAASIFGFAEPLPTILYALAIGIGGAFIARAGVFALRARTLDINLLITIAAIGAAVIGEWAEGGTVVFLFSLGNLLEAYTMDRTRRSIHSLMDLAPAQACIRHGDHEETVPVQAVPVGTVMVVRPGERIGLDGRVVAGSSAVNQAPITGESLPVQKGPGDDVFAGTINGLGALDVAVTRPYRDTTLARIVHLIEVAQAQRAPSQQFIDRFARVYTPAIIGLAVAFALVPPLVLSASIEPWLYRALVLLVVSCPCALVISTPVSIVAAIGNAARHGILIKGGAYLEAIGGIRAIAFDKTGTITRGRPEVTDVIPLGTRTAADVLAAAASVEYASEHPLGASVRRAARQQGIAAGPATGFQALAGKGVRAVRDGETCYVGSRRMFEELALPLAAALPALAQLEAAGKTALLVGNQREVVGVVGVADNVRAGSREAVARLRGAGVRRIALLTGDNPTAARRIAGELGVDEYRAGLMPEDKVTAIRGLMAHHGAVAMVGDGVNDAPALATATVGIAMGVAGSDTALETADVALLADDLAKVPYVVELSRRTRRIIRQNIAISLLVKAVFLALAFPGWVTLWMAVLADMGSSLLVTANGMRLLGPGAGWLPEVAPTPAANGSVSTLHDHAPNGHDHDHHDK